jgi:hypothetical protein
MENRVTTHTFNIEDAKKYGVDDAVLLANIRYWTDYNEANCLNFHDGRYWTYNSRSAFAELFPYWTEKQIRRIIENLLKCGAIVTGNYNKSSYDRTLWYAIKEKPAGPFGPIEPTDESNLSVDKGQPIPDIKPDDKPNEKQNTTGAWRKSFEIYKAECIAALKEIVANEEKMESLQRLLESTFDSSYSALRTLRKAINTYWLTERGWKKKKSARSKKIDWYLTCQNIVQQEWNLVKGEDDEY